MRVAEICAAGLSRPRCGTCGAVYTPTGPHWDGTNHTDDWARAAGWGIWDGTTVGGKPMRIETCPTCRRGGTGGVFGKAADSLEV